MSEAARPARPDDLAVIAELLASVVPTIGEQRGGSVFLANEAAALAPVAAMLDDDDSVVVVGTYDDVVLGVATMAVITLADGRRIGHIGRFVTDPEARGSGIGEAMMNLLLAECEARHCVGVQSTALPGDRATKNFFESFGLKARLLVVMRALD